MPRIKECEPSNIRPSKKKTIKVKYFFALEGTRTEVKYLQAIVDFYNPNALIFRFYRNDHEKESSNILKNIENINKCIENNSRFDFIYENLGNAIYDKLMLEDISISRNKIKSLVERVAAKNGKSYTDIIVEGDSKLIIDKVNNYLKCNGLLEALESTELIDIISENSTYFPDIDKIIVVADRDKGSFVSKQYDKAIEICEKNNFCFIVSNPCIEFWFLLHFTNAKRIRKWGWKSKRAAKLVFKELKKYDKKYSKNKINCKKYINAKETAIENSLLYCTNIRKLKHKIGTNMKDLFSLFEELNK